MLQARSLTAGLDDVPFCEMPMPHTLPVRATARKIAPSVTPAPAIHRSSAALAHCGMGTVRMWPPLPIRSTIAQWPWRIWISSSFRPTSSDLRKTTTKQ
jgi:hypothetical protein